MPKLDTTIDNLERKTNKVTGNVPSSSWTDAQYPSAKTLYSAYANLSNMIDLVHPIGSILTTATNVNPSGSLGGSWELVDKSLKNRSLALTSAHWINPSGSELKSEILEGSSYLNVTDHTISIRIGVKTTAEVSDSDLKLGKLIVDVCGVTELMHAMVYDATISENSNCTICYKFDKDGTLTVCDVFGTNGARTAPIGTTFYIHTVQPVYNIQMIDEFCDKFYWKRTA